MQSHTLTMEIILHCLLYQQDSYQLQVGDNVPPPFFIYKKVNLILKLLMIFLPMKLIVACSMYVPFLMKIMKGLSILMHFEIMLGDSKGGNRLQFVRLSPDVTILDVPVFFQA